MKRLIKSALYSFRTAEDDGFYEDLRDREGPCDLTNPKAEWEGAAARISQIDRYGQWSCALGQLAAVRP